MKIFPVCWARNKSHWHHLSRWLRHLEYFFVIYPEPTDDGWRYTDDIVKVWNFFFCIFKNQSPTGNIWSSVSCPALIDICWSQKEAGNTGNSYLSVHLFIHSSVRPSIHPCKFLRFFALYLHHDQAINRSIYFISFKYYQYYNIKDNN